MAYRSIFYDTETTGTFSERDKIIEIAAYDPLRGKTFERLINPGMPIPKESMAIHQITDQMVQDAASFQEVGQAFIDFCDGDVALIAHNNAAFDLPFLRAEMKRANLEMPSRFLFIDSLKWARRYRKDLPRHSLQYLRQIYGVQENQAHRALNDVMVLYEVFSRMVDDLTTDEIYLLLSRAEGTQDAKQAAKLQANQAAIAQNTQPAYSLFT